MNKKILTLCFLIILILGLFPQLLACDKEEDQGLDRVVFALDWTPNTNHAGLFLARDRGYFRDQSIDLELRETDMNFMEMVAGGSAAFGMAGQEQVLQARASKAALPVLAIAAVLQENSSGFAAPLDRGIRQPEDFEGKGYSGWGTELELAMIRTLMEKRGADYSKVKVINQSAGNFIASMELEADFAWIYYGWDGIICEQEDYPIHFIPLRDIEPALDFYSPVIISNESVLKDNPDLVRRFLLACERGYREAMADPEAAVDSLIKAAPGLDRDLLLASMDYLSPLFLGQAPYWGAMDPVIWTDFARWMEREGLLDSAIQVEAAFETAFLPGELSENGR